MAKAPRSFSSQPQEFGCLNNQPKEFGVQVCQEHSPVLPGPLRGNKGRQWAQQTLEPSPRALRGHQPRAGIGLIASKFIRLLTACVPKWLEKDASKQRRVPWLWAPPPHGWCQDFREALPPSPLFFPSVLSSHQLGSPMHSNHSDTWDRTQPGQKITINLVYLGSSPSNHLGNRMGRRQKI